MSMTNAGLVDQLSRGYNQAANKKKPDWETILGVSFMNASMDDRLIADLNVIARDRRVLPDIRGGAAEMLNEIHRKGVGHQQEKQIQETAHLLAADNHNQQLCAVGHQILQRLG